MTCETEHTILMIVGAIIATRGALIALVYLFDRCQRYRQRSQARK